MNLDARTTSKLGGFLYMRYVDGFAHLSIGQEDESVPDWEDYLEELGIGTFVIGSEDVEPQSDDKTVEIWDPVFTNVIRKIPGELAQKALVLGEFPRSAS